MSTLNISYNYNYLYSCNDIKQNYYNCNNTEINKIIYCCKSNCNCSILTNSTTINIKINTYCKIKYNLPTNNYCHRVNCDYMLVKRCHYEQILELKSTKIENEAFVVNNTAAIKKKNFNNLGNCCKHVKITIILLLFLIILHFVANLLLN